MNLKKNMAQEILRLYEKEEEVTSLDCIVNIDYFLKDEEVIKYYTRVYTKKNCYILKLMRLPMCPDILLEKQAELSQQYRIHGISTPECYLTKEKRYCAAYGMDELELRVLLEEDAGEKLCMFSQETILQMAQLLGKMHAIALENKWHFRQGSFDREFNKGNTEYLQLWNRTGTDFLPKELLEKIIEKYNGSLERMKQSWETLPVATVHGDLYRMNLMAKNNMLMLIDYDRAGDEVLLSDFLITWFRILFDPVIRESCPGVTEKKMWRKFLSTYEKERALTEGERGAFADQYAVLGAVYGTRNLVELAVEGKRKEAADGLMGILEILEDKYGLCNISETV